jgi:hypothetical protein
MHKVARLVAPLGLAAALLAGCGDDGGQTVATDDLSPKAILARAADATVDASTLRMSLNMVISGMPEQPGDIAMNGTGSMDFDERLVQMQVEMPDLGQGIGGTFEVVVDDTVMYMRIPLPDEARGELGDKSWFRIDLREASSMTGVDPTQQMWNDPRQSLAMLEGVSGGVTVVGHEEVRGADTTHYHAEVDVRKAVADSGAIVDEDKFNQFAEMFGTSTVPIDVWIDGDNQVRRMQMNMSIPSAGSVAMTTEFYDFGEDVDISLPPADEVMDWTELMRQSGQDGF